MDPRRVRRWTCWAVRDVRMRVGPSRRQGAGRSAAGHSMPSSCRPRRTRRCRPPRRGDAVGPKMTSTRFSWVTTVGSNSCEGVSNRVVSASGVLPLSEGVGDLGGGLGDDVDRLGDGVVLVAGDDALDRGQLGVVARDGRDRSRPADLNAAIAPPPVPSFAATTPTIWSPNWVIWPPTHSWASGGAHSGRVELGEHLVAAGVDDAVHPVRIRPAAASVGEPLTWRMPPLAPVSSRWSTRDWAMEAPMASLSKET